MKITMLFAVAFAAVPLAASAQTTITQTIDFTGVPDFTETLVFDKFSGNASDILNINISYSLQIVGGLFIIDNDANSPATVTANFGAELSASSTDVTILNASFQPILGGLSALNTGTFNLAPNQGDGLNDFDGTGPDGATLVGTTQSSSGSGNVNSIFYSQYAGGGTFNVIAKAKQIGSLSFNSGIETATTPVSALGSVTITYTVIPEPSSLALVGLGTLGLALRRRRA